MNNPLSIPKNASPGTTNTAARNPFLFIVGSPRSGTTMLRRMINAHPQIQITRETHWIPKLFEKQHGMSPEGIVSERIVDKLFDHHRFSQMKIKREALLEFLGSRDNVHYCELVSHIFDNYGKRKKKPLVGDKTPTYVRKLPTLVTLWPHVRILHLIRDGRDVWLSMRSWRMAHKAAGKFASWRVDPLVTTALWWKALVAIGRRDGALVDPGQYREVRYESLVAQPDAECQQIADFLGVEHVAAMERYYEGRTRSGDGLSANGAWLPPTPGRRRWQTQMETRDIELFEAAAGDLLDELGMERACASVSPKTRLYVEQIKRQFASEVGRRWNLPVDW